MKQKIDDYVKGKTWYLYLPGLLFGVYAFFAVLKFSPDASLPFVVAVPQAFDFFLHEVAHIVTAFLPELLVALAGSFSELLLGTLLIVGALRGRAYFTVMISSLWFMLACQSVGAYMADARAQQLELFSLGGAVSGSDETIHDWHFIFDKLHLLSLDKFLGYSLRTIGAIVGLAGLVFAAWLVYKMAAARDSQPPLSDKETELLKKTSNKY